MYEGKNIKTLRLFTISFFQMTHCGSCTPLSTTSVKPQSRNASEYVVFFDMITWGPEKNKIYHIETCNRKELTKKKKTNKTEECKRVKFSLEEKTEDYYWKLSDDNLQNFNSSVEFPPKHTNLPLDEISPGWEPVTWNYGPRRDSKPKCNPEIIIRLLSTRR